MNTQRITGDAVVRALKSIGRVVEVRDLAEALDTTDTRAVATASRKPAADGRIRVSFPKRGATARYKFVRLTAGGPKKKG